MRLDFNQMGSWRRGPDFPPTELALVQQRGRELAVLCNARLRIVDEDGEVSAYWDKVAGWRDLRGPAR